MSAQPANATVTATPPLYAQIGQRLAQMIDGQVFRAGQRLPSVRELATQNGVSVSTAVQAFHWLEERHLVNARPKAGYFVAPRSKGPALPATSRPPRHSLAVSRVSRSELIAAVQPLDDSAGVPPSALISFGGACPRDPQFFDMDRVRIAVTRAARVHRRSLIEYTDTAGTPALRTAIAQRALHLGCTLRAEDIITTASCTQALGLDLIESLGLRVLEIPTHAKQGMSLAALQLALDTQPVKAVLSVPTLSNPLGSVMKLSDKRALVQMLAARQVPLIEDVVFNDLLAADERRRAAKSFDTEGGVMVCGSFAKTVASGLRLGWVEAGRWKAAVTTLKRVQGAATNIVLEQALADLLTQGGYEARMRRLAGLMRERLTEARRLVSGSFPRGSRISDPQAGYTLWVELPGDLDAMALYRLCLAEGLLFGPGALFTATGRFRHCLRLSFAGTWGDAERRGLLRIGELARQMAAGSSSHTIEGIEASPVPA